MHHFASDLEERRWQEVRRLRASLETNPVFHLSLNSKELFHSNLLAWLFDTHPDAGRALLERLGVGRGDQRQEVRREHRRLDLSVKLAGLQPVVIENKVFDLPDDSQLRGYTALTTDDTCRLLLSLTDPAWPSGELMTESGAWSYVSYAQFRTVLLDALETVEVVSFDRELLIRYAAMIDDLVAMADATALDDAEPIVMAPAINDELSAARLLGAMGKRRARQACRYAARNHRVPVVEPTWNADFSRTHPLIEAFFEHDGDQIGWQYQADQWRIAVKTSDHQGKGARPERENYVRSRYASLFNFDATEQFGASGSLPCGEDDDGFCGFEPNFVYRYRRVSPLSAEQLSHLSNHCLDHLAHHVAR